MKKSLLIIGFLCGLTMISLSQDDDPFSDSGGNDDPFGDSTPTANDDPFADPTPQPTDNPTTPTTTPPASDDPFGDSSTSSGGDDPFGTSEGGGLPDFGSFGGSAGVGSVTDNLSDTLIQPLRDEFPWKKRAMEERQMLASYSIRESDVFWAKTVWREIDLNEKMNHPFAYPQAPFLTILIDAINKNSVPLYKYDPFTDAEFQEETTWQEVQESMELTETTTETYRDDQGNLQDRDITVTNKFNVGSVEKLRLKEVWYFDKKHSRMRVEIMGIAPIRFKSAAESGVNAVELIGTNAGTAEPMFWVYYPDVRKHLARYETFNPLNDALRMSWDDLLTNRFFASYIVKASNPLDQYIANMTSSSLDALYEGEKVKDEIFNFEHDLWSY